MKNTEKSKNGELSFIKGEASYENAKYVFAPIPYTHEMSLAKAGVEAILKASNQIEDYDIETDGQTSKSGFFTLETVAFEGDPKELLSVVEPIIKDLLKDQKTPILLGGDHSVTLGALAALKEEKGQFSVLHLDAHADLRESYNGSPYNERCAMKVAEKFSEEIVHVGIRSYSNREKGDIPFDRVFFAMDLDSNDYWIKDVVEEFSHPVYITIDASVFDPACVKSVRSEPGGLSYMQVLKLLKAVIKKHTILGIDIVNLQGGDEVSARTLAKLIYQCISFIESK